MKAPSIYLEIESLARAGLNDSQMAPELGLNAHTLRRLKADLKKMRQEVGNPATSIWQPSTSRDM